MFAIRGTERPEALDINKKRSIKANRQELFFLKHFSEVEVMN